MLDQALRPVLQTFTLNFDMAVLEFVMWISEKVLDAAEKELYDPEIIQNQLMEFSEKLDAGEISMEEYDVKEADLLERMEISMERETE